MKVKLNIKKILIYSEENDKYFYSDFGDKLNVIYGKNTAGKSTLIQLILYCFGINDNKIKLTEILSEGIFVRLDCSIQKETSSEVLTLIRQDETLLIKDINKKVLRFNGINSDNSVEHIKLKKFFNELFDFNLLLESKSGISEAPIETIFLPYYVSQDVGWVYLRKSFRNLDFYRNFKEDFLDYYLGIENTTDRKRKREIENEISGLQKEIAFFTNVERENRDFEISKNIDDSLTGKANELVKSLSNSKAELSRLEEQLVSESNKLTFYNQRLSVVSKVKRNHTKQFPGKDKCPTCTQSLPLSVEQIYVHFQEDNDTEKEQKQIKEKIKCVQSKINSLNNKIEVLRNEISDKYISYSSYNQSNITLDSWLENKANIILNRNLTTQLGALHLDLVQKKEELSEYKTEDDIIIEREKKNYSFKQIYLYNNAQLGLPTLEEERFYKVYEISSFPFQGVQLHLAVLSYHFAFNKLLTETEKIHRLPFILDSVFKEDIDGGNKQSILKFINSNYPNDTQTILSIADDKNNDSKIEIYSKEIFKENAHLICIGDGEKEKALLKPNDNLHDDLINESYEIIETI
ncbi:hypothetical protein [uncultured Acetobacteroides sp.]|uniref:hypothetical protein n=1 Tax=uncultured Acetobacteroides sp. TaxID=1760811 RepID=UPI0029F5630F|nr:hypothetical protein [uncultured Acetobacteroides sp.]